MAKSEPKHVDLLGRSLGIGDCVAFPDSNSLKLGTITKLNPKMIKVRALRGRYESHKYPFDAVKVDGPDVTLYILRNT